MSASDALAWGLGQPVGSNARVLADAVVSGITRVAYRDRVVEYKSNTEMLRALNLLHSAASGQHLRPFVTIARVRSL